MEIILKPDKNKTVLKFKNPRTNRMDSLVYNPDIVSAKYIFNGAMEVTFKDNRKLICII